ncbi:PLP-dependent aminotransferase family protein [Pyxidicoccus parkwayensis]|uniref:PLP-dependent aminotransferase family protein n=1 Tax=Pyxidicoccus parkwayensis TaxID=2813578 RepID=A0ABX7NW82_9BACT|nr:PLP-dependent aminotransferase family protein [Pyxidicoccus parkwaysis]QSQ23192.1 PLP-dependent aminotransferase family protein [Pyxidicoccus parkwaysis]
MLSLPPRQSGTTLTQWLYEELRRAMLSGRLRRGASLPTTRALAAEYGISRRIVVEVFERLRDEGYLHARVGVGTRVSENLPEDSLAGPVSPSRPRRAINPLENLAQHAVHGWPVRPFRAFEPALSEFPVELWARLTSRCMRRAGGAILAGGDSAGLRALREAIAEYLGASRGVACSADDIIVTSGAQQGLDLLARVLLRPDDSVWVEDPAYPDAVEIFRLTGAKVVPVAVDAHGIDPKIGRARCPRPKAIYLTPAHQFPLGMSLRLDRRLELLQWTRKEQTVVIEDDYDSEFRFSGKPLPALKGLGASEHVFLVGTFSKCLFPSLRLGYIVAPQRWRDPLLRLRRQVERYPPGLPQLVLASFLAEGHFARHLRRMRELYAGRLALLRSEVGSRLGGLLQIPDVEAGLNTPAYLLGSMTSREAVERARRRELEVWPLERYALARKDLRGLLLGFAALSDRQIRKGVTELARALG